ncbi:hypothetical protein BGW38_005535, partial [Lunasporangiospora selenospora]
AAPVSSKDFKPNAFEIYGFVEQGRECGQILFGDDGEMTNERFRAFNKCLDGMNLPKDITIQAKVIAKDCARATNTQDTSDERIQAALFCALAKFGLKF